jgi:predicted PurR-regulated permease PerM
MALLPIIGTFVGLIVGALLLLPDSPWQSLAFIIFIIVLQQFEGNFIYPRVVGRYIELPGMWVLFAVVFGGGLYGIVGVIIGVPLCSLLYSLAREITQYRINRKDQTAAASRSSMV